MQPHADLTSGMPESAMPSETTIAGGISLDPAVLEQVARYVQQHAGSPERTALDGAQAVQHEQVAAAHERWRDERLVREVVRTALLNRIERFGERELRQRSAQEIAFILLAFAVAALIAVPALVPFVVALRGGQL